MSDQSRLPVPPDTVSLDTSLVIEAIIEGTQFYEPTRRFLGRLTEHGSRVYFSQLLWSELSQALYNLAKPYTTGSVQIAPGGRVAQSLRRQFLLHRWERNWEVRRNWIRFGIAECGALFETFESVELPYTHQLWEASIDLMAMHRLRSHDAIHLATTLDAGIADLATIDNDFKHAEAAGVVTIWNPTRRLAF